MAITASSPGRARFSITTVAIWAALLVLTALAWIVTVAGARTMGNMPGTMGLALPAFLAMWTVMMAAMMLPSVAPVGALYVRAVRHGSRGAAAALRVSGLISGYLIAWAAFGLVAYLAARLAGYLASHRPEAAPAVGAAVFIVCGLYQITPLKERCLAHCRSPLGVLLHLGNYRGRLRDLRAGLYHGAFCVGCCWALMIVMVMVGVMNLAWMVALALVILIEKVWRHGKAFGYGVGIALIVFALFIPGRPELIPGLAMPGSMVMP